MLMVLYVKFEEDLIGYYTDDDGNDDGDGVVDRGDRQWYILRMPGQN